MQIFPVKCLSDSRKQYFCSSTIKMFLKNMKMVSNRASDGSFVLRSSDVALVFCIQMSCYRIHKISATVSPQTISLWQWRSFELLDKENCKDVWEKHDFVHDLDKGPYKTINKSINMFSRVINTLTPRQSEGFRALKLFLKLRYWLLFQYVNHLNRRCTCSTNGKCSKTWMSFGHNTLLLSLLYVWCKHAQIITGIVNIKHIHCCLFP